METESDRLASIQGLGGQLVSTDSGSFWAIFDSDYVDAVNTETLGPVLTARTSDALQYAKAKDTAVTVAGVVYRVRKHEPDGTGFTLVWLGK
jgi:hypothetical protein